MIMISAAKPVHDFMTLLCESQSSDQTLDLLKAMSDSVVAPQARYRFYYWGSIKWLEFSRFANSMLAHAFENRNEKVILPANDHRLYEVNFKTLTQKNMTTGYIRSIAWECSITGAKEGFSYPFQSQDALRSCDLSGMQLWSSFSKNYGTGSCSAFPANNGCCACRSTPELLEHNEQVPAQFQSKAVDFFSKLGEKVVALESNNTEFKAVSDTFLKGLTRWHGKPKLTAVHKVVNSDAKLAYFGEHMLELERSRSNANLRYAWHGSSADSVASIVLYGFGQRPSPVNGNSYGSGIYLAPFNRPEVSACYSILDENDEQHVLLCEVLLGESEVIPNGSRDRFLPSSTDYDSGTDDINDPSLYVIWSPFINSHVLPWYIVSFVTEESTLNSCGPMRRSQRKIDLIRSAPYALQQPSVLVPQTLFHPCGLRTAAKAPLPSAGADLLVLESNHAPKEPLHNSAQYSDGSGTCQSCRPEAKFCGTGRLSRLESLGDQILELFPVSSGVDSASTGTGTPTGIDGKRKLEECPADVEQKRV